MLTMTDAMSQALVLCGWCMLLVFGVLVLVLLGAWWEGRGR